jgi:hypothetical protein
MRQENIYPEGHPDFDVATIPPTVGPHGYEKWTGHVY